MFIPIIPQIINSSDGIVTRIERLTMYILLNSRKMSAPDAEIEKPLGGATKMGKVPKMAKVKNKAPAELQITAEQLLREAKERELEIVPAPPKQKIQDEEELKDFQMRKRKTFEDTIRKNRSVVSNWIKYATWEESQGSLDRTRYNLIN